MHSVELEFYIIPNYERMLVILLARNFQRRKPIPYCSNFRRKCRNICARVFCFLQTSFDFLTSFFDRSFQYHSISSVAVGSNLKKIFHLWSCFVKLWGFKECQIGSFGTINARYRRFNPSHEFESVGSGCLS